MPREETRVITGAEATLITYVAKYPEAAQRKRKRFLGMLTTLSWQEVVCAAAKLRQWAERGDQ